MEKIECNIVRYGLRTKFMGKFYFYALMLSFKKRFNVKVLCYVSVLRLCFLLIFMVNFKFKL
jgi:hypothetical protein